MDALTESMLPVYFALVLGAGFLTGGRARRLAGVGLCLAGLGTAADRVGEPGGVFTTTNEILLALGAVLVLAGLVLDRRWRPAPDPGNVGPIRLDGLLLIGLIVSAIAPHLFLLAAGALVCMVSAALTARRSAAWLLLLFVSAAVFLSVIVLLLMAMGPLGGSIGTLASGPVSPRAERALGGLAGAVALVFSGIPPLHRAPWRSSLAPLGAVMMARLAVPALALGLDDWQAVAMLALAMAMLWAASRGAWEWLLLWGGFLAFWSALPEAVLPGCALVLAGWLRAQRIPPFAGKPQRPSMDLLAGGGAGVFALDAALRVQVLVSVLAVLGVSAGLLWGMRRDAIFSPPSPG